MAASISPPSIRPSGPRRIAFAGGDTVLIPGSLHDNLLYGCPTATPPRSSTGSPTPRRRPGSTA